MSKRKYFHDSVTEFTQQTEPVARGMVVQAATALHHDEPMTLHFSFEIDKNAEQELAKRVAGGEVVSAAELDSKYGLKAADTAPLKDWLLANGYQIIQESTDHTSVFAQAPAGSVAKSLEVEIIRVTKNGITYNAARNAPSLPENVSAKVHAISGLQPFRHLNKHRANRQPLAVAAAQASVQSAAGAPAINQPPFFPSAILTAFGGDGLGLDGSGQTIGILIDTFPNPNDLTMFWSVTKVPGDLARVNMINVSGRALPTPEGEESLDAEWTSGIAPGAKVNIYATGSLVFSALDAGLQRILSDAKSDSSLRQISISLGLGELHTSAAEIRTQSSIFLRLAALGVNVFVSSGDSGSNPDGQSQSGGALQVEYPASDPNVIAVGGTSITLNADNTINTETGWPGSGGGKSKIFPRPIWQVGNGVPSGKKRLVPDIAAVADPHTGALVILNQNPQKIGGTSWSAPIWAGILALRNQSRVKSGLKPLPFLNPLLYKSPTMFRDVTQGCNGAYVCGIGYDMVTGLGSPIINKLP